MPGAAGRQQTSLHEHNGESCPGDWYENVWMGNRTKSKRVHAPGGEDANSGKSSWPEAVKGRVWNALLTEKPSWEGVGSAPTSTSLPVGGLVLLLCLGLLDCC